MAQIRVLRIIARLNIGGPAIHTVMLTAGLDKNRFSSVLVCGAISKEEGDMGYYAEQKGVIPIYIPQLKRELNPFNDFTALIKIIRIVVLEKPDIIHTHTAKAGTLGRVAGIAYNITRRLLRPSYGWTRNDNCSYRVKLFHTFHGHVFDGYFNSFSTRMFILIEKILAYFTDQIITVSENVKSELISLGITKADKIEVIPLGFELDKFLEIMPRSYLEILNIGVVGRLVPIKNHRLFLEAVSKITKETPQIKARFKIIGDGGLRAELEEYSRQLNIGRYIEFLGWKKDLPQVYADLDIVCLTSLNEGTPVSLIEAMASGRAVVATEVGGVGDILGEAINENGPPEDFTVRQRGVTARSRDASGIARALKFALENKKMREKLSKAAREYVKGRFAKERLIKDMENLYLKTLKIGQL